ncbi:MAG: hypothetical protein OXP70_10495 [Acidobacteriota bacterium]|nr:hypothetical protein [Acidobacteriota bacterium]MYA10425.1 hypothetical protein [Gemmatimonadota bacterium]
MTAGRSPAAPALVLALLCLGPLAEVPGPPAGGETATLRLSPLLPVHLLHATQRTLTRLVRHAAAALSGPRVHTHAQAGGDAHA